MKKMILTVVLMFVGSEAMAQQYYDSRTRNQYAPPVIIAPNGTMRIQNGPNGNSFYDRNGSYAGRSLNTGGGSQSLYDKHGIYQGRVQKYGSGYRYTPTPQVNHLHNMPHTTHHR